jgi:hypothetical protein
MCISARLQRVELKVAISAFDRRLYTFECPNCHVMEAIPLARLVALSITCAACGVAHDLKVEPHVSALRREFALAQEEDDRLRTDVPGQPKT